MSKPETPAGASSNSEISDACIPLDLRPAARARRAIEGDPSDLRDLDETALLALLLRGPDARGLARAIHERYPDLGRLRRASREDLAEIAGLDRARARAVRAAVELGRRIVSTPWPKGARLRTSREVYSALAPRLRDLRREVLLVILLDGRNRKMEEVRVSEGSLSASIVHPREVFLPAVRASAAAILVAHNHPSGDPRPSPEDREVTGVSSRRASCWESGSWTTSSWGRRPTGASPTRGRLGPPTQVFGPSRRTGDQGAEPDVPPAPAAGHCPIRRFG